MNYENILPSDVSDYTKEVLNAIVFEHPSLTGIENSFQSIEDNIINLEVGSVIEKNTLLKSLAFDKAKYIIDKVNKEVKLEVK